MKTLPPSLATMLDELMKVAGDVRISRHNDRVFASLEAMFTDIGRPLLGEGASVEAAVESLWTMIVEAKTVTILYSGGCFHYTWDGVKLHRSDA